MCGRFTYLFTWQQLCRLMGMIESPGPPRGFIPRYNVAPTQDAPIIRLSREGEREAAMVRWGLAPFWAKDPMRGPINARAETLATKRTFRKAFESRRCLVPASGFYEWQKRGQREPKQPWYIHPAQDEPIFAFAGLWERWGDEETGRLETFAIITTDANERMRPIHDRMPAIIPSSSFERWLDPESKGADLDDLLRPASDDAIEMHPISPRVNKPAHDDPSLVQPIEPESGLYE